MQKRRGDFERELPSGPQAAEEVHGHDGFGSCSRCRGDAGEEEDAAEEGVSSGKDAVEDDGDVGEEFGDDIEGALLFKSDAFMHTYAIVYIQERDTYPKQCKEQTHSLHPAPDPTAN